MALFRVVVDSDWHFEREFERYEYEKYWTLKKAKTECRRVIWQYFVGQLQDDPFKTAVDLIKFFPVDHAPFILPTFRIPFIRPKAIRINALEYARECANELRPPDAPYVVRSIDNWDIPHDEKIWEYGTFRTLEEAQAACRKLVDGSLDHWLEQDTKLEITTAEKLYEKYRISGENPFIMGGGFNADDYARERAKMLRP